MLGAKNQWHYSGSFYAIRNHIVFANGVPKMKERWFGFESWPGDHVKYNSSACIFGDNTGRLYDRSNQPRDELIKWKAENAV